MQASVAATVAATWFELRGLEVELLVVDEISKSQRDSLEMVERPVSADYAHELDRLRVRALLHNVEATAPDLERRRAASRNALAVARTNQRLAVVSIYKTLGGGWEVCAQAGQDCSGAERSAKQALVKQIIARP